MTNQQQIDFLQEKLSALKSMTVEAREHFKKEIEEVIAQIKALQQ